MLRIARDMVEAGCARAVMGNHEFNGIAWATTNWEGGYLRPRTSKNQKQHGVFLEQIGEGSQAHVDTVAWFRSLPIGTPL